LFALSQQSKQDPRETEFIPEQVLILLSFSRSTAC